MTMHRDANERLLHDVLGPMQMQMRRAEAAYRAYLADGRRFIHTRVLRESNEAVRDLLLRGGHLLPEPLQADALALIAHLDAWLLRWYDTRNALRPSLDDAFVFENPHVFPREAAERLRAAYAERAAAAAATPPATP